MAVIGTAVLMMAALGAASPAAADALRDKPIRPSSAQPADPVPAGFSSWDEVYLFQARLNSAAEAILAAGDAGNASIVADPLARELRVYFKGDVPAQILGRAKQTGVPVTFAPAAFTHAELVNEAKRLSSLPGVVEVAPRPDGGGLAVTVADRQLAADRTGLQAATAIPLTLAAGERPQAAFSRQADVPLFWGGSRYQVGIDLCTNGFPVLATAGPSIYQITAGHCGSDGAAVTIPGRPSPTGTFLQKNTCRDTALILYPSGNSPAIYTGGPTSSSGASVVNAVSDFVGNLVATGGASSGEHRNVTVQAVDVFTSFSGIPCTSVGPMIKAGYSTNTCVIAPGDSGGPVYSPFNGNTVVARGTITGFTDRVSNCPGAFPNGGRTGFYAPLLRPEGNPQIGSLTNYAIALATVCCANTPVTVPNVIEQDLGSAAQELSAAGLQLGSVSFVSDPTCNFIGLVKSQNPSGGTLAPQGSAVNVSVGTEPPTPCQ